MKELVEIDGSYGEGGGQILRTALFLSTILKIPVRVYNVRIKRENPGLKRQHLHIIKLLKKMAGAKVEGDELGSTEIFYSPANLKGGEYSVDFKSAGSISLFLQTILPVSIYAGRVKLEVFGGTEVPMSPTIDWVRFVYLPYIRKLCSHIKVDVLRRGYYPMGGGHVVLSCECKPKGLNLWKEKQGYIQKIFIHSVAHTSLRERKVAERQAQGALEVFKKEGIEEVEYFREYSNSASVGTSITIWAIDSMGNVIGADNLGQKGKPAETVGSECATKLLEDIKSGAVVDRHTADHLVPWLALYGGRIKVPMITPHLESNVWVCNKVLGRDVLTIDRERLIVEANL